MITQEELKKLVHYCPDTGVFVRLLTASNKIAGSVVGCIDSKGYVKCRIAGRSSYAHRLAFLYMEDTIPNEIDHIDNNPSNNAWTNLRKVSRSANQCNSKLHIDSSTNIKGLSYRVKDSVWKACIVYKGKQYQKSLAAPFSCETTKQCLTNWIMETRTKLHGEYTNHG